MLKVKNFKKFFLNLEKLRMKPFFNTCQKYSSKWFGSHTDLFGSFELTSKQKSFYKNEKSELSEKG